MSLRHARRYHDKHVALREYVSLRRAAIAAVDELATLMRISRGLPWWVRGAA